MSNPPTQPPPQQQRPPPSQQQQQRPQQQQKSKARDTTKPRDAGEQIAKPRQDEQADTQRQSTIEVQEETRVEGKGGAKNLATQWVDVWLPEGKPMYIIVTTLPDHDLQVSMEQRSWKKSYAAKGRVQTDVVPIAPIGTTGKLVAKDATTGEELTVNFHWHSMGGTSLFGLIVKLLKRLFTNQKS